MKARYLPKLNRCDGDFVIGLASVSMNETDLRYGDDIYTLMDSDGIVYKLVKEGKLRYYIPRGADTERIVGYSGRYGEGFMLLTSDRKCSAFSNLAYYVQPVEGRKRSVRRRKSQ